MNIVASESLFRLGFVSNLLVFTVNIFVAVLLYKVFEPVNKTMAGMMVILILVGVAIAMLNELNQFAALLLLSGGDSLATFTTEQLQALATLFLDIYEHGFVVAHIFFGLWLFPMGYLVIKSSFMPKIIGIFLIIACVGYVIDFILFFLFPEITVTVSGYTFVGEVLLLLWLLVMGVNVQQWKARSLQAASI
jgi:hypothetical protein